MADIITTKENRNMSERDEGQLQGEYKPSKEKMLMDSMYKRKNQMSIATGGYLHDVLLKFAEDRPRTMPDWLDKFDRDYGNVPEAGRYRIGWDSSLQALFDKARKGEFLNEEGMLDHGKLDDVFGSWYYEKIPQEQQDMLWDAFDRSEKELKETKLRGTEDFLIDKLKRIDKVNILEE